MNIDDIIVMLEDKKDKIDRAIAYAEVISYLKSLKAVVRFDESNSNWKNHINDSIVNLITDDINKSLVRIEEMFATNLI